MVNYICKVLNNLILLNRRLYLATKDVLLDGPDDWRSYNPISQNWRWYSKLIWLLVLPNGLLGSIISMKTHRNFYLMPFMTDGVTKTKYLCWKKSTIWEHILIFKKRTEIWIYMGRTDLWNGVYFHLQELHPSNKLNIHHI